MKIKFKLKLTLIFITLLILAIKYISPIITLEEIEESSLLLD